MEEKNKSQVWDLLLEETELAGKGPAGCSTNALLFDMKDAVVFSEDRMNGPLGILLTSIFSGGRLSHEIQELKSKSLQNKCAEVSCITELGFALACVPLVFNEQYYGYWLLGPLKTREFNPNECGQLSLEYGEGVLHQLQNALKSCPVRPVEELETVAKALEDKSRWILQLAEVLKEMQGEAETLGTTARIQDMAIEKLYNMLEASEMGVCVSDLESGEILLGNQRFSELVGVPLENIIGKNSFKVANACFTIQKAALFCPLRNMVINKDGTPKKPVVWESYASGTGRYVKTTSRAIPWIDERYVHINTLLDITREHSAYRQLEKMAYYDRLTALPNTLRLIKDLKKMRAAGRSRIYLLCLDLPGLRSVRNAYGTVTAESMMREIALWLESQKIPFMTIYHGEGYVLVLRIFSDTLSSLKQTAKMIRNRFLCSWLVHNEKMSLELDCEAYISIIGPEALKSELELDTLPTIMDRTFELARQKKRMVLYDQEKDETLQRYNRFELHLRHDVQNSMAGFEVYFQPIVNSTSGAWTLMEALCRWKSYVVGEVSPVIFIPRAEEIGLIGQIGKWVLEQSVNACVRWNLQKSTNFLLSVNVSPVQLADIKFSSTLREILQKYGYPAEKLCLEITETAEYTFMEQSRQVIEELRGIGVKFALDDFGTGYSSFKNLKDLPVDIIKTEREFINDIEYNSYMQFFFHTIASLAHVAGVKLIAEGVENAVQRDIASANGADYIQGFLYQRPVPLSELGIHAGKFFSENGKSIGKTGQTA